MGCIGSSDPNAQLIKEACRGKNLEQVKVIEYFCKQEGCLSKNMTDDEYMQLVLKKRDSINFKEKALSKIGLDEDEVREIAPAKFEGFVFKNAYAKRRANGCWVSSAYQVSWVFFSSTQVYIYRHTYSDNTVGFYCPATDEIFVDAPRNGDMTEIMATIEHESLHLASNGGLNGNLEVSDGVSSYRRSTNINEGVTELYAMRDMNDMGFDYDSSSYQQQVDVVKALEDAMGKDTIREAYFGNNPELLRADFENAFATDEELKGLGEGKSIHNGKYIDFLNSFDEYIGTSPSDASYSERRDKVYNMISEYKTKRRITR